MFYPCQCDVTMTVHSHFSIQVPRRKAVYCFVKFDALKQRENQTHRIYDEVSDVDFNEDCQLDVTGLEKSNNEVLSDFDVEDESDMPLETLLTEKPEDSAMQAQKTSGSKLFHIENNRSQSQGNINGYISNSFMDGNSQGNINGYISNSFIDYNSYFYNNNNNNSICRGNSFSDARNGGFEKSNYFTSGFPQYGSVSENNNNQVSNSGTDSCVASLVYKSTLVSNDLDTQEQKASGNFQQATCGMPFENVWQPGPGTATLPTRNDDATDPTMTSSFYFDDMDFDTTLNDAFKELERLVMLNKLMET